MSSQDLISLAARARLAFFVAALACLAGFARARGTNAQAGTPLEAARDLFRVYDYLESGSPADIEAAASVLDLAGSGAEREERARYLVRERLAKIFDRLGPISLDLLPAPTEAELAAGRWSIAVTPPGRQDLVLELGFARGSDGQWRVDRETVQALESTYAGVRDLPRQVTTVTGGVKSGSDLVRDFVPRKLQGQGFLLEPYQWVGLLLLLLVAFLLERVLTVVLRPLVRRLGRFDSAALDPELLRDFERPLGWILLVLIFSAALPLLDLPASTFGVLRIGAGFFLTVAGVWAAYRLIDVLCWPLEKRAERTASKFDDMLVPLLRRTLKVVVVLVGVVFLASQLTGDVWHVLAGLSIGSLAVGFAAKDSIENLFGTFTVLLDSPFKIGDLIRCGDIEGEVESVGFRSTRIRTHEDSLITVPNSRFIASHVDNLGSRRWRRVRTTLSLTYDTPPEKIEAFCEGVRELIRAHPYTRKESFHVWLGSFAASSLDVGVIAYLSVPDYATFVREQHRFFLDVLRLAERLKVSFAFPTQTTWRVTTEEIERQHADRPGTKDEALARGRSEARDVAATSLAAYGGKPPPPVRFDPRDPDAIVG